MLFRCQPLSDPYIMTHLIFITTVEGKYYFYLHFMEVKWILGESISHVVKIPQATHVEEEQTSLANSQ